MALTQRAIELTLRLPPGCADAVLDVSHQILAQDRLGGLKQAPELSLAAIVPSGMTAIAADWNEGKPLRSSC